MSKIPNMGQVLDRAAKNELERCISLYKSGNYEEALKCFDMALMIKPRSPEIWREKGIFLAALGRHEEAMACYDRANELENRGLIKKILDIG